MADPQVSQAARRTPPGTPTNTTVGATSTTAVDMSALEGHYVMFQFIGAAATDTIAIVFGESDVGAAVLATHINYEHLDRDEFFIDAHHTHFRAIASSASCEIRWVSVGA